MSPDFAAHFALWLLLGSPIAVLAGLGLPLLGGRKLSERAVATITQWGAAGAWASASVLAALKVDRTESFALLDVPGHTIVLSVHLDGLARLWAFTATLLCLLGIRFAESYLHREKRFASFHLLFGVFELGMVLATVGGNLNTVFLGWELAGVSSAFLIAFFCERKAPVQAGLRAFAIYRITDVGFIAAAALLHHQVGDVDFGALAQMPLVASGVACGTISFCLLIAAAGKSAQLPVSGWLARAMEGPTPSSALFYGGLSVHLGVMLLIRAYPLFAQSPAALWTMGGLGALTALHATAVARVQTDVKSALAYATLTQVGLMLVECALGWTWLAAVHLCLHAFLRTFQLLRAPSALAEAKAIRAAHQGRLPPLPRFWSRGWPQSVRHVFHAWALERFGMDLLLEWLVSPWIALSEALHRGLDGVWRKLGGRESGSEPEVAAAPEYLLAAAPLALGFAGREALLAGGAAVAVFGAALAFSQRAPYRVLGGVGLSMMGTVAFGFSSPDPLVVQSGWLFALAFAGSLAGLFVLVRAVEKRVGGSRLRAADGLGLIGSTPALAGAFACLMLAAVGFPGTLGFVAEELLLGGAYGEHPWATTSLLLATAVNGFTLFRLFARIFFGPQRWEVPDLALPKRLAAAALILALLLAGLFPRMLLLPVHGEAEAVVSHP